MAVLLIIDELWAQLVQIFVYGAKKHFIVEISGAMGATRSHEMVVVIWLQFLMDLNIEEIWA